MLQVHIVENADPAENLSKYRERPKRVTRGKMWYNTSIMVITMCRDRDILIYTAGLIDGEGYISVLKKKARRKHSRVPFYADAVVKVASIDKRMIDFLYNKFGGYQHKRIAKKENHKDSWAWEMKGTKRVHEFLTNIFPYLIVKKENAEAVLSFTSAKIASGNVGNNRGCRPTTPELYKKLDKFINLARSYTARGHDTHRNATSPAETK